MGVKFGVLHLGKNTDSGFCENRVVRRIFDEREVRIEGCRGLCSELHVCYCSPGFINIIVEMKIKDVSCNMHIVMKVGIQRSLTKLEQEEPLGRPQRFT